MRAASSGSRLSRPGRGAPLGKRVAGGAGSGRSGVSPGSAGSGRPRSSVGNEHGRRSPSVTKRVVMFERDPELGAAIDEGPAMDDAEAGWYRHRAEDVRRSPVHAQSSEFDPYERRFEAGIVSGEACVAEVPEHVSGDVAKAWSRGHVPRR